MEAAIRTGQFVLTKYNIWWFHVFAFATFILHPKVVYAQVSVTQGKTDGGSLKGVKAASDSLIADMVAVSASLVTLYAIGMVFAVKMGWVPRERIKDAVWLGIIITAIPLAIPTVMSIAQTAAK